MCLLLLLCASEIRGQVTEVAIKAELIERFILFTRFPEDQLDEKVFIVCVFGEDALARAIEKRLVDSNLHDRKTIVRRGGADEDRSDCHVLIITQDEGQDIAALLTAMADRSVLTIASSKELAGSGVMINVLIEDRQAVFEVDQAAVDHADLELSSMLLRYARIVDSEQ